MENLLSDPTVVVLILIILGILGLAGGAIRAGSLSLQTVKGRISSPFSLFVVTGLAILIIDLWTWWVVE